jgi:acetylornithine/succinyldiaminopimelate/putrescine aminotransferase
LLVFDEIQTGFGRTGTLWGFEKCGVIPDIILLGKALGGGLPLGAFIADRKLMSMLTADPVLGHITTFGGHPLSCAAGLASLQVILEEGLIEKVKEKSAIFLSHLDHRLIRSIRNSGFWLALEFDSFEINKKIIDTCISEGVLTDWFLFAPQCLRISPPLTMTDPEIKKAAGIIQAAMEKL